MFYLQKTIYLFRRNINSAIIRWYKPAQYRGENESRLHRRCEAKALARAIYEIEHADWETRKAWRIEGKRNWDLADGIWMSQSDDCMCWHLWREYDDQARQFCKIIPAFYYYEDTLEKLLYSQPWVCI